MKKVLMDQVGFLPASAKKAVLNFDAPEFKVVDESGNTVFEGKTDFSLIFLPRAKSPAAHAAAGERTPRIQAVFQPDDEVLLPAFVCVFKVERRGQRHDIHVLGFPQQPVGMEAGW